MVHARNRREGRERRGLRGLAVRVGVGAVRVGQLHRRGRTGGVGGSAAAVTLTHGFMLGATTHWVAALLVRRVSML